MHPRHPTPTPFPYTTLFQSSRVDDARFEIRQYEERHEPTSIGLRLRWWSESIPLIAEAPLFGHGTGTINSLYAGTGSDDENRSEEHTSELQSLTNLVCRLLL